MNGDDKNHEERRKLVYVSDRPIELQSMLQTLLTFLLLGVMSWVGLTLEKVKDNTALNNTRIALGDQRVAVEVKRLDDNDTRLERKIDNHIINPRVHRQ